MRVAARSLLLVAVVAALLSVVSAAGGSCITHKSNQAGTCVPYEHNGPRCCGKGEGQKTIDGCAATDLCCPSESVTTLTRTRSQRTKRRAQNAAVRMTQRKKSRSMQHLSPPSSEPAATLHFCAARSPLTFRLLLWPVLVLHVRLQLAGH